MFLGDQANRTLRSIEMSRERDALSMIEKDRVATQLSGSNSLGEVTHRRRLSVLPSGTLGARDSAHDVFFVATPDDDGKGPVQTFACKRFRRGEDATHELEGIRAAQERGFRTLEPVGEEPIETVDGIGHVLVTKRVPRFTTLNQLGWQNHYAGQPEYGPNIAAPLQSAAKFVGHMHRTGITHGDMQLKNLGQVPPGRFVLFDLEGVEVHEPQDEIEEMQFRGKAVDDLGTLVTSLVDRGYLWHSDDEMFAREVTTNVFDPYLEVSGTDDPDIVDGIDNALQQACVRRGQVRHEIAQQQFTSFSPLE